MDNGDEWRDVATGSGTEVTTTAVRRFGECGLGIRMGCRAAALAAIRRLGHTGLGRGNKGK